MASESKHLREVSIADLFFSPNHAVYEVPIYQRNYAWGIDEITALVQDVYDAYCARKDVYFIGTLVTFHKGKRVYEVIDGQQRLTTIYLVLKALGISPQNELTFRSREKSSTTIQEIDRLDSGGLVRIDQDIANGFTSARKALELVPQKSRTEFEQYFQQRVHIIFYVVPKDVDLNHYFEVMNSRGEQLEQHEVVKAALLGKLGSKVDRARFGRIWECCSQMDGYIQQKYSDGVAEAIFGNGRNEFLPAAFDDLPAGDADGDFGGKSIRELLHGGEVSGARDAQGRATVRFQPIIDFPNFLLIVLKLTRMGDTGFDPAGFALDDKEIIRQFDDALSACTGSGCSQEDFVKEFAYNLLLSRFFLDNYIVHHTLDEDQLGDNPWKLQCWGRHDERRRKREYPMNLFGDTDEQGVCEQLLSMFEVSFTARQRKNYLLYCMLWLRGHKDNPRAGYPEFLAGLARAYLWDVYLGPSGGLNERNAPMPGRFDEALLEAVDGPRGVMYRLKDVRAADYGDGDVQFARACERFGNGEESTRGIPLFVFNYLDYLLWEAYRVRARGCRKEDPARRQFFESLGCSDFGLELFDTFYFSRTRRSLEHFYSQAMQALNEGASEESPTRAQINCLGNYAMIGREINASGSNWSPYVKLEHYMDMASGKVSRVSVASLKFMVMMRACKDAGEVEGRAAGQEWLYPDMARHQAVMIDVLLGRGAFGKSGA